MFGSKTTKNIKKKLILVFLLVGKTKTVMASSESKTNTHKENTSKKTMAPTKWRRPRQMRRPLTQP